MEESISKIQYYGKYNAKFRNMFLGGLTLLCVLYSTRNKRLSWSTVSTGTEGMVYVCLSKTIQT